KSSSNYPALQKSISSMFQVADYLFIGSLVFASLLLTLLLVLWLNARRREVGILLALGLSKVQIAGQFVAELVMISIPAFLL
ncbi:FtsX-like permease family protein, partial [Faecalibacillus faecis]